jgi:Arc/MetJ-type ribon-helix-helix transcriptional regulator
MGAIAVSREDEAEIEQLMKEMKVKSKASVVRVALRALSKQLMREKLRTAIQESVRKCAHADRKENIFLSGGGVARKA